MSEQKPLKWRWLVWSGVLLVLLPVLYVASVGPVVRLQNHGYIPDSVSRAIPVFYRPLLWLDESDSRLGTAIKWYARLWL